jgi:hypothetical protein
MLSEKKLGIANNDFYSLLLNYGHPIFGQACGESKANHAKRQSQDANVELYSHSLHFLLLPRVSSEDLVLIKHKKCQKPQHPQMIEMIDWISKGRNKTSIFHN